MGGSLRYIENEIEFNLKNKQMPAANRHHIVNINF